MRSLDLTNSETIIFGIGMVVGGVVGMAIGKLFALLGIWSPIS